MCRGEEDALTATRLETQIQPSNTALASAGNAHWYDIG